MCIHLNMKYLWKEGERVSVAKILYRKTWYVQSSLWQLRRHNVQERNMRIKGSSYNCMEDGETMLCHGSIKGTQISDYCLILNMCLMACSSGFRLLPWDPEWYLIGRMHAHTRRRKEMGCTHTRPKVVLQLHQGQQLAWNSNTPITATSSFYYWTFIVKGECIYLLLNTCSKWFIPYLLGMRAHI